VVKITCPSAMCARRTCPRKKKTGAGSRAISASTGWAALGLAMDRHRLRQRRLHRDRPAPKHSPDVRFGPKATVRPSAVPVEITSNRRPEVLGEDPGRSPGRSHATDFRSDCWSCAASCRSQFRAIWLPSRYPHPSQAAFAPSVLSLISQRLQWKV